MKCGEWVMGGGWRVEGEECRVEGGGSRVRVAGGGWRMVGGGLQSSFNQCWNERREYHPELLLFYLRWSWRWTLTLAPDPAPTKMFRLHVIL